MVKLSDFQSKDVINIMDGRRLGVISDFDLDLKEGYIKSIIVPAGGKFLGLFSDRQDIIIPWRQIRKIGVDVILVELDDSTIAEHRNEEGRTIRIDQDKSRPYYRCR
ncbi:YlmC/YmxH family sporulation protein [Desulfuribacillus alkaliarsenatis]|uniref:YlmC/YmxH family sporulation protein n=1 Tax=Desulfuribacillus alkaliarsenatis TaxID=766136 RepID=A0A1E5FZP7_9FIRM|nr:YlmC/YmxH family sporulation protein [Desulfuribacillus alkaliarsenatis]OEF96065.1 YlmC/YmxH family sporulation protein [Desulfuribacillus alkaliarsenatis]